MKKFLCCVLLSCASSLCHGQEEAFDSSIAIVDMNEFNNPESCDDVVATLREAMHEHGFFAVINTGIDTNIINEAFSAAAEYFALEESEKMGQYAPWTDGQRGYIPFGSEKAKGGVTHDFKEYYHIGRMWSEEQLNRLNYPKNVWPMQTDFRKSLQKYVSCLEVYMKTLQKMISLAMGCEENFFDSITGEGEGLLRVIHYPAMKKNFVDKDAVRASAHTDINMFTILPEATAQGLEVLLPDGTWMPIYAQKDSMIVNVGDMVEAFSNGYFKSAVHRVVAPKEKSDIERYSMVFFVHGKKSDEVYPLPQCVEWTQGEERYAHATVAELKAERFTDNRQASDELVQFLADSAVMDRLIDVKRASYDAMCVLREKGLASRKVLAYLKELEFDKEDLSRGRCQCCEVTKSENIE